MGGVAVIARNTWTAMKGREALKIECDDGPNAAYDSKTYQKQLAETSRRPGKVVRNEGDFDAAYDKAARYLADRHAFGAALLDEPTIRFTLADMATALETSRTLLWRAATALDDNHPDKVQLCAMAKRYVTDACFDVADQALQLHGGYGYLTEYGLEKIVRDLRVHRILEGTNEIMRVVIGRAAAGRARNSA